MEFDKVESPWT